MRIARVTSECSEEHLHHKPDPAAWSTREILAHLRARAEVGGRGIERMLAEEHPTIRYVSPRGWIKKTDYLQQSFRDSLTAFSDRRVSLVNILSGLDAIDWSRSATLTGTTQGREATVLSYAKRIADHEAQHLSQLQRMVKG